VTHGIIKKSTSSTDAARWVVIGVLVVVAFFGAYKFASASSGPGKCNPQLKLRPAQQRQRRRQPTWQRHQPRRVCSRFGRLERMQFELQRWVRLLWRWIVAADSQRRDRPAG